MAAGMINVTEAKKMILENANVLPPVKLSLTEAAGMVLAENIYSAISIPAYAQSSMDGYAIRYHDWKYKTALNIKGEMAAGSSEIDLHYQQETQSGYSPVRQCPPVQTRW